MKHTSARMSALGAVFTVAIVLFFSIGTSPCHAASSDAHHFANLMLVASEESTDLSVVSFWGYLPDDVKSPASIEFSVPGTYKLRHLLEISLTSEEEIPREDYKTTDKDGFTTYRLTLDTGNGIFALFDLEGSFYGIAEEMKSIPMGTFSYYAKEPAQEIILGIAAPSKDVIGAGKDIQLLAVSEDDTEIYGKTFQDINENDLIELTVAFTSRAEEEARQAERVNEAREAIRQHTWYNRLIAPDGGLYFLIACALLILCSACLVLVVRSQRHYQGDPSDVSTDEEETLTR